MSERIEAIRDAVQVMHKCVATHVASVPVVETHNEVTVWEGVVEVFDITGNPKAKRCYGWRFPGGKGDYQFVTVLDAYPVKDPVSAVRASIMAKAW
jgi:hypothetical protein